MRARRQACRRQVGHKPPTAARMRARRQACRAPGGLSAKAAEGLPPGQKPLGGMTPRRAKVRAPGAGPVASPEATRWPAPTQEPRGPPARAKAPRRR
eukprot:12200081-Alexandrium_andersonii.AAC.1